MCQPVCIQNKQPVEKICHLETTPFLYSHRWFPDIMETGAKLCFPPFALLGKCLHKIRQEGCRVTLIVSVWSTQPILVSYIVGALNRGTSMTDPLLHLPL